MLNNFNYLTRMAVIENTFTDFCIKEDRSLIERVEKIVFILLLILKFFYDHF